MARIGRTVNQEYGGLVTSIGLQTSVRTTVTALATIGDRNFDVDVDKVEAVFNEAVFPTGPALDEISYMQMRDSIPTSEPCQAYAVKLMGARTVTLYLDCVPTTAFPLVIDGLAQRTTLQRNDVPSFPEDFHDLLVYGAMVVELNKMEKPQQAAIMEQTKARMIGELRYFIIKSKYLQTFQGQTDRRGRRVPV